MVRTASGSKACSGLGRESRERRWLVPITNLSDQETGSVMRRGPVGKESTCSGNRALILPGWR